MYSWIYFAAVAWASLNTVSAHMDDYAAQYRQNAPQAQVLNKGSDGYSYDNVGANAPPPPAPAADNMKTDGSAMATGVVHEIVVGGSAGTAFTPSSLQASPGDVLHFTFMQKNHTVTQSSFDKPCEALQGGQDSGFRANVDGMANPAPTFEIVVSDTKASWFYCRQKGHCGMGMVLSVNPPPDKTHDAFVAAAKVQGAALVAASPAAVAAAAAQPAQTGVVAGAAVVDNKGQCGCSCFCGVGAMPNMMQGIGMMGGAPGYVPMKGP